MKNSGSFLSFLDSFSSRLEMPRIYMAAEILMAVAFYFLMAALIYFLYIRKDLKFRRALIILLFLFFAGTIHLLHVIAPWYPIYGLELSLKFAAAVFAIISVFLIKRLVPQALQNPELMKAKIQKLEEENDAAQRREESLRRNQEKTESAHQKEVQKIVQFHGSLQNDLKQFEQEIVLLPTLMEALSETYDFDTALETTLKKICGKMGWEYGEAWVVSENGKVLEYSPVWYGDARFETLRRISQDLKFPPDMELTGRVWASKKFEIIPDFVASPNGTFFRAHPCKELGLKAAIGIPVFLGEKVLAVLVFLMSEYREQDNRRVALVTAAVGQMTSVLEKKLAERALQEGQDQLEKRIRERTKELIKANEGLEAKIIEHQQAEESLRNSQENFSTLVNSIEGIVWEFDLETSRFSFVSEQAERMLGYPVEAWLAEPTFWQDHIHGGERTQALAFRAQTVAEKKGGRYEYRMITADGQTIWLRDLITVVLEKNKAVKLRGVTVNITEPKQVEEALNQERSFVSTIFETASALVMVLDTDGRIVRFNRACEQTSGYLADEAKNQYFWDLFSVPEEIAKNRNLFSRLLAGQFPINDESYWVAKDGNRRAIAWSNTVLMNRYGSVIHIIATGVDITKRKEVEQKLKEAIGDLARSNQELDRSSQELKDVNQRLRELDEIKSHFISAASHELRTPLTSIKGYVESFLEDEVGPLTEQQREFLGYVKTSADRLYRLLNELLDISKIESGQIKMSKELTNVKDLLKEEVMIFKAQANNKNIALDMEPDGHLRDIYCDPDKIKEVMDNLLSNAIKYTGKGGKVKIEVKNNDGGIQIDVIDNGIGIQKEDLMRIFEPFQHIENNAPDDEEESTGLGLTLVKRIVEAHDGAVLVQSEEGKGATFTVILPIGSRSDEVKNSPWVMTHHE